MPLKNYGVLVGRVVDSRAEGGADTPHFQVHVRARRRRLPDRGQRLVAATARRSCCTSPTSTSAIRCSRRLPALPDGRHRRCPASRPGSRLDFIRGNLFDRAEMQADARRPLRGRTMTWPTSWPTTWSGPPADPDAPDVRVRRALGTGGGQAGQDLRLPAGQRRARHPHEPGQQPASSSATTASGRTAACCCTSRRSDQWVAIFLAFQSPDVAHRRRRPATPSSSERRPGERGERDRTRPPAADRRPPGQPDRSGARIRDRHA